MNKTLRIITLMLIAVFLIAGTAMTVFADAGDGGDVGGGDVGGDIGGDVGGDGGDGGDGGNIDPGYDPGVDNPGDSGNEDPNQGGNEDPNQGGDNGGGYVDPGYVDPNTGSDNSGYSQQTYIDDSPMYYGDASKYEYNSGDNDRDAGTIDAPLYSSRANTSDSIRAQQWENLEVPNDQNDIKLNSGSADGDVSFADLKSDTSSGDNMKWLPYLGIVLIALAVLGILYFIIATITQSMANRKALLQTADGYGYGYGYGDGYSSKQRGYSSEPRSTGRSSSRGYYPETRIASADDFKRENLSRSKARSRSDYSDGYNPSTRRGAKADTGEIRLPRRFK